MVSWHFVSTVSFTSSKEYATICTTAYLCTSRWVLLLRDNRSMLNLHDSISTEAKKSKMWRSTVGHEAKALAENDEEWDTDPNFENDVSEREQRWGAKTVEGSGRQEHISLDKLRNAVSNEHEKIKKETFEAGPKASLGYGGRFGVERDRMDKSAVDHAYKGEVSQHSSQTDTALGFGGKYGVQKDRVDKSAVGFDYKGVTEGHASQKDYSHGFGGKFGVQRERVDKCALGWGHKEEAALHQSQTDYAKGFGGKYGVQKNLMDKSAAPYSDVQQPTSSHQVTRPVEAELAGKASALRRQFERMEQTKPSEDQDHMRFKEERDQRRLQLQAEKKSASPMVPLTLSLQEAQKAETRIERPEEAHHPVQDQEAAKHSDNDWDEDATSTYTLPEDMTYQGHAQEKDAVAMTPSGYQEDDIYEETDSLRHDTVHAGQVGYAGAPEYTIGGGEQENTETVEIYADPDETYDPQEESMDDSYEEVEESHVGGGGLTATAIYDYDAAEEGEIFIRENDIITDVQTRSDGWWWGICKGCEGLFPGNYVELIQ
uniref:hematopoietic lineage cell-specific protein-like isoform X2 n=1 Tax=Myxine glutinosa TaxID=7769 RepID=UPI00358F90B8